MSASQNKEQATHDDAVKTYSKELCEAAAADLWKRNATRDDQEGRWVLSRRAALQRRIMLLGGRR